MFLGQRSELNKQLQYLHTYAILLSDTYLKPYKRLLNPNENFYWAERFPGGKNAILLYQLDKAFPIIKVEVKVALQLTVSQYIKVSSPLWDLFSVGRPL
jgi:hypothetical protein